MKLGNTKLSFREVFLGSVQFMNKDRKKKYMEEEEDITSNCCQISSLCCIPTFQSVLSLALTPDSLGSHVSHFTKSCLSPSWQCHVVLTFFLVFLGRLERPVVPLEIGLGPFTLRQFYSENLLCLESLSR